MRRQWHPRGIRFRSCLALDRIGIVSHVLAVFLVAAGTAVQAVPPPGPASRVRTVLWDFGVTTPGTELRHRFTVTNPTTTALTVKFVNRTCACTVGEFSPRRLNPAASGSLEVSLRAPVREGKVYQALMVEFAERGAPLVQLVIQGEVRGLLSASPASVDFGRLAPGAPARRSVELRNFSSDDVAITKIETPDGFRAEHTSLAIRGGKDQPRQAWRITLTGEAGQRKPGSVSGMVTVQTSSAALGPVRIPVTFQVPGPLTALPARLGFDTVAAGQNARKLLLLEAGPELGDVTEDDLVLAHDLGEELEVQVSRTANPRRFVLAAVFQPKRSRGVVEGELRITVRKKMSSPLRVKITAEVP